MRRFAALIGVVTITGLQAVAASAGGGGAICADPGGDRTGGQTKNSVTIAVSCFDPMVLRVEPGTTVTFWTKDPWPHTVTSGNGFWTERELIGHDGGPDVRFDVSFPDAGIFPYYCRYHISMGGTVIVGDATDAREPGDVRVEDGDTPELDATNVSATSPAPPGGADVPAGLAALGGLAVGSVAFAVGRKTVRAG